MIVFILLNYMPNSLFLLWRIISSKSDVQEFIFISFILLRHSVVVVTLASCLFMYCFWYVAMHLDRVTLMKKLKINTPIPAKKVMPKYLNRNPKHMSKMNGKVATAGN